MRKLMWFTIGFGAACAIGAYLFWEQIWLLAIATLIIGIGAFLLRKKWKCLRPAAAVFLGAAVGIGWFLGYDAVYLDGARAVDGQTLTVTAIASDYSYETDYGSAVEGKLKLEGKEYSVLLYLNGKEALKPGDRVTETFRLRLTHGGAEESTYHRGNGMFLLCYQRGEVQIIKADAIPKRFYPAVLRQKLINAINRSFPEDTAFFARALLLGDRTGVDYAVSTAFKVSGISHIIAVSGLHVSILFSLIYLFSGRRRVLTAVIGIPIVLLFAAIAGFTPSITRACLMQILMMLAMLFDKEYDPATALSFAVLVMLAVNPMVITAVGFQLSVGCMAGIFLFSDRIKSWIQNFGFWKNWKGKNLRVRLRQWFASGVSVTLSAMFFTTPLVAYYFGAVSIIGILTNLLTLWVVTVIFYGIMAVCLLTTFWQWGAMAAAWTLSWLIRYVLVITKVLASFPLAAVYTRSIYIVAWLVLCYGLLLIFLIAKDRQPHVLICCGVLGLCVALCLSWAEPLLDDTRMTVLDVGQGQCILLQAEGKNYLVDCGGDSDIKTADLAAETLLSQGISRLDGVIVTHFDRDHAGGVRYLLSRVPADAVFLPDAEDEEDILGNSCNDAGNLVNEDVELRWGEVCMTIFAPVLSESDNESGLSVLFRGENCDILITGDLSTLGESLLLMQKQIPELTALVVGHHGSKSSTGEKLLAATSPRYAFISVGADNPYGQPNGEVLERLERFGCAVYRTDESGTIIFRR